MLKQALSALLLLLATHYSSAQWTRVGFEDSEIPTIHSLGETLLVPVFKQGNTVLNRSNDFGANWDSIGVLPSYIYELANVGDTLFASTSWDCTIICPKLPSVFRSLDTGASWDTVYTNEYGVFNLVAHNHVLFFQEYNEYKKSEDYGETWLTVEFDPPRVGTLFSFDGILYGTEMYKSTDNGETWTSIKGDLPITGIRGMAASDSFLFVFNKETIFRSKQDTDMWQPANSGLPSDLTIWHLTATEDGYLAASSTLTVYFSKDNGSSWIDISEGLSLTGPGFINWILIVDRYLLVATDEGLWRFDISPLVSVKETQKRHVPHEFKLRQNYPNPFNSSTTISYSLRNASFVTLVIYDILGREVQTLVQEFQHANFYSVTFDASHLSSGIYLYRLKADNDFIATKKMILNR
jgi:hypothetical protein